MPADEMSVSRSPDSPDNAWPLPDRPTTSARSSPKRRTALRDGARPARAGRFDPSGRSSAMSCTMCSNRRTGARSTAERRATSPVRSQRRSKVSGRGFRSSPGRRARKASGSQERQGLSVTAYMEPFHVRLNGATTALLSCGLGPPFLAGTLPGAFAQGEMPVANRRFEMFEYRQLLTRMRLGDTDRAIARVGLMGRRKAAQLRLTAEAAGWLDVATALPGDAELAVHLGSVRTQPAVASLAEPHRERITRWWRQGIQGTTIHGALVRSHGFTGSYSSVRRFLAGLEAAHPQVTTVLEFDPGEAAQVDFGKDPEVLDPRTGELLSTWVFVMTLAWSRHAYAEVVTDQKVATWLGCHRRAFEWFNGVPERLTIDNPKCAITRACYHDPEVQRA